MLDYDLITREQPESGGWVKILTLHQNYLGSVDWRENNIKFKVYQSCSTSRYTEKNYYLSNYKGNNSQNTVVFCDLDDRKGSIECRYLLNNGNIDVYAKGGYVGVPIKLQVIECPNIGRITLWQRRGFEALTTDVVNIMVKATVDDLYYSFPVNRSGSKFYYDTAPGHKLYREYSATRFRVIMKDVLTVTNSEFTGDNEYVFRISEDYVPTWAFEDEAEYTEFVQDYSYKPTGSARVYGNKCRLQIYRDGIIKVSGMKPMDSNTYSVTLYLNVDYKRTIN